MTVEEATELAERQGEQSRAGADARSSRPDAVGDTASAMSEENVRLVREAFQAFVTGDQQRSAQLVDPEVEFHGTVGGLQEGQVAHGQSEIEETFESEDLEAWEERRLEAEDFIDAGNNVVVLMREYRRGRGSGVELESKTALVVGLREGRVARIQGYLDRRAALEAVGRDAS